MLHDGTRGIPLVALVEGIKVEVHQKIKTAPGRRKNLVVQGCAVLQWRFKQRGGRHGKQQGRHWRRVARGLCERGRAEHLSLQLLLLVQALIFEHPHLLPVFGSDLAHGGLDRLELAHAKGLPVVADFRLPQRNVLLHTVVLQCKAVQ